jgi:acetolactate synthase-1/2/3 large subunit
MSTNEMTGGEVLARMIVAHKGGPMFGMGGFQLLPFYDAARRLGMPHHLINDERAAIFAADAYAKISGRVGLADATLGPCVIEICHDGCGREAVGSLAH